jgi:hypothetical protein
MNTPEIIVHALNQVAIGQRVHDGHLNATALCQAAEKRFADYQRLKTTEEFLATLSRSVGIPTHLLVEKIVTGPNEQRGTWVHPQVAIHLAIWCSAEFAVQVTGWVEQWYRTREHPLHHPLRVYQGLLALIREVKTLLEDLHMFEAPDRLLLADHVRNVLMAASGQLSLPGATHATAVSGQIWHVGDRIMALGYPQRSVNGGKKRIHPALTKIGRRAAQAYRHRHGAAPMKATRYVDGAPRQVSVYGAADVDLLDQAIEEVLGAPPSTAVVAERDYREIGPDHGSTSVRAL